MSYIIGLDPGKKQDPAALATIHAFPNERAMHIVDLVRFPVGTAYTDLTSTVIAYARHEKLKAPVLVVDVGGVGEAVRDVVSKELETVVGVMSTSGFEDYFDHNTWTWYLPKTTLVENLERGIRGGGLKAAPTLALLPMLVEELTAFRRIITKAGHTTYSHRTKDSHGDLAIAAAMAYSYARMVGKRAQSAS